MNERKRDEWNKAFSCLEGGLEITLWLGECGQSLQEEVIAFHNIWFVTPRFTTFSSLPYLVDYQWRLLNRLYRLIKQSLKRGKAEERWSITVISRHWTEECWYSMGLWGFTVIYFNCLVEVNLVNWPSPYPWRRFACHQIGSRLVHWLAFLLLMLFNCRQLLVHLQVVIACLTTSDIGLLPDIGQE